MLTPITITGTFINPDGSAPSGGILFTLSHTADAVGGMEDSATGQQVLPLAIAGIVVSGKLLWNSPGGGGYNPLILLANDDSTTLPVGTFYTVTEKLSAGSLPSWQLTVHHTAPSGIQDISTQRPVP